MDRAYETGEYTTDAYGFSNGWQYLFTFYILFASVRAVGPGIKFKHILFSVCASALHLACVNVVRPTPKLN